MEGWGRSEKGRKGLPKFGVRSRWSVEAETMDSGKKEVSQAGALRLITSHPRVFTRADARYMFGSFNSQN